jgi:hypothetical protein
VAYLAVALDTTGHITVAGIANPLEGEMPRDRIAFSQIDRDLKTVVVRATGIQQLSLARSTVEAQLSSRNWKRNLSGADGDFFVITAVLKAKELIISYSARADVKTQLSPSDRASLTMESKLTVADVPIAYKVERLALKDHLGELSNFRINLTAQQRRCWVPFALRAKAAGYARRSAFRA